jgi:N-acetylglucosaminyl-diphospho-decaprenol L-rhamnosyltransferase
MQLLVVIVNYRTPDMTLDAARAAVRALDGVEDWRLDIVDNDSEDGSFERLEAAIAREGWRHVRVLESPKNGGFGYGNNVAISAALRTDDPPELVYLLNSDAFPEPDAIRALLAFMREHPEVGIAGSEIHGVDGAPHVTAFRFPTLASEGLGSFRLGAIARWVPATEVAILPRPETTQRVDWLAGASMMVRREVFERVGLFDDGFFLYYEETDLCLRAAKAGWPTWYVVESRVAHVGHGTTGLKDKRRPMPKYWFESRRHFLVKSYGRAYAWAANTLGAVGLSTFGVRARIQRKESPDPAGYLRDFVRFNFLERWP